jgi:type VI secretion system VasD/TssJ family lipoprotein
VSIRASDRLNPGDNGESLATTVRVYQLKDVSKLEAASLEQLLDNDRAVHWPTILSRSANSPSTRVKRPFHR